ncbi:hypothetical protein [Roseateles sp.]|uniref:hypothetical protein n=1 Tax=Roseateles sp. TaxID=1971397 RepID=UPI0025F03331|nr:hypothetical protein [Roseateles sp.]
MFKKPPLLEKPAQQRLQKVAAKRARAAKAKRAVFLAQVKATAPTEETREQASRLVDRVRAAKAAPFLQQYRLVG